MGEEVKKAEEKKEGEAKKPEEEKKEEAKGEKINEEKKAEESKDSKDSESKEPPPPEQIVLRVDMHCEGCARKVKRCLTGFEGVEDVKTDCKSHKVVVRGKNADPLKVLERVQRKCRRKVELLSPIPKPPTEDAKKGEENKEIVKPEEKKEEPQVITVVLKVHMHCEACAQEIRKRIQRMKGVEAADPDLNSSQVTVKGVFDPQKLVEYFYRRAGKHAVIVKQEPEKKEEKDEKKGDKQEKDKGGEGEKKEEEGKQAAEDETKAELRKNEFYYYYPPKYTMDYVYPPQVFSDSQIFSDENPNACSVM